MPTARRRRLADRTAAVLALLLCLPAAGCGEQDGARSRQDVGLYSSLPVALPEAAAPAELLAGGAGAAQKPHWAMAALAHHGAVSVLDTLAGRAGALPLEDDGVLVMAQPRPLTPQENVALDGWVRRGGRVLLMADPMLTAPSIFAPGDPRRPQDVAMLSPILSRWGLSLNVLEDQPDGPREVSLADGAAVPVNVPGFFVLMPGQGVCRLESQGLLADCRVGKGRVLAMADAALMERDGDEAGKARALDSLLGRLEHGD